MPSIKGKTIWLTGASLGIGEALARRLAREGCSLALSARNAEKLESLAKELNGLNGSKVSAHPLDVTDKARVRAVAEEIKTAHGPVDILITSAGTYIPSDPRSFDSEEYDRIMRLNYSGTLYCVEAVLPAMIERRSGHLVPISSLVGYRGLPRACSYGASKAAVINFFESLRFDVKRYGVGVSIVNPGFVKTPLTDKNDFEMPFLISSEEAAERITQGIVKGSLEIHFPWQLSWIFKLMRILPFPIYNTLIGRKVVR